MLCAIPSANGIVLCSMPPTVPNNINTEISRSVYPMYFIFFSNLNL